MLILYEDIQSMKQYYPNIPDEVFQGLVELDPTYKRGSNNAGTYGKWILRLANQNNGEIDRPEHLTDVLKRFDSQKKQLKNKDIMRFKSVEEVDNYLNDDSNYVELSDRQKLRDVQKQVHKTDVTKDADKVYEDSTWEVWVPKTYEASCKLGSDTSWCTASTANSYYYEHYTNQGPLYIVINKSDPSEKYQFHLESYQFMNKNDYGIDIYGFLKENEGLYNFFEGEFNNSGIAKELDMNEVSIDVSDIAKQSDMDSKFVEACFESYFGDNWDIIDYFESYGEYANDTLNNYPDYVLDDINDENKKILSNLGVNVSSGTAFLYDLNRLEDGDYEDGEFDVNNDLNIDLSSLKSSISIAYSNASDDGAVNACMNDFKSAITNALKHFDYTCDGNYITIKIDKEKDNKFEIFLKYGDLNDRDEYDRIVDTISEKFFNEFYEPRYGWEGFDKETFNDMLFDNA